MPATPNRFFDDPAPDLPRPAVLCTIVKVTGSAPQETGIRMWVGLEEFQGTLGGGEFERRVLQDAREMLGAEAPRPHVKEFPLCKATGQCCGGRVEVFFEPLLLRKRIYLFGAGHVGRAAGTVLSGMPVEVSVIDPRPEWAEADAFPNDIRVICQEHLEFARSRDWGPNDAVCIFTHSHDLDFELASFFLPLPLGYLGMIGSEHKARVFQSRLAGAAAPDGSTLEDLWAEKMRCPLGLTLPSKNPKVIAVSLAAELLRDWALIKAAPLRAG